MGVDPAARRTTLAAVAQEAGVSIPTVSKVLNGRRDVSVRTRARVEALLDQHRYLARGPQGHQAGVRTIGLVFDALQNPNNLELIRGVTEAASDSGVDVVVGVVPDDPAGAAWARRVLLARREGLIVTSRLTLQHWQQFNSAGVPLVTIDPANITEHDIPSVGATNFAGGMDATAHLIALGHTAIGFIEGPAEATVSVARMQGYRAALSGNGMAIRPELMRVAAFTYEAGFAAALELLAVTPRPTALVASNDLQALGAIEAARTRSLRVPEELSVVGFDDAAAAAWSSPPLTTVRQPIADMGRAAVRRLLQLIAGERLDTLRAELATQLIVRNSTAAPSMHGHQ